jgi:hypothetical protein
VNHKLRNKKINILIIVFLIFIFSNGYTKAEEGNYDTGGYKMLVPFTQQTSIQFDKTTRPIGEYIQMIYTYALSIVGILSTIVMMFAGFLWMTAGGNASRVQDAQAWIASALTGLVLALFSYTFLYLINPALVSFKSQPITQVKNTTTNNNTSETINLCCVCDYSGFNVINRCTDSGITNAQDCRAFCDATFLPNGWANFNTYPNYRCNEYYRCIPR